MAFDVLLATCSELPNGDPDTTWLEPLPLYARVDIASYQGQPSLMELELVEPSLFFENGPAAMDELLAVLTNERSMHS